MEALKRILNHVDLILKQVREALSDEDLTDAERSSCMGAETVLLGFREVVEHEIELTKTSQKGKKK